MADSEDATKFTRVDETRDTSFFVKFLDARTGIEGERQVKELEIVMLAVDPGACVLDVGCGTGDDAREIAGLVGPNGKVVGLDSSVAMVEESRKRASSNSLPVEFVQGDAYKLQFPDRSFDRIRADRVFVHLQDPERALDEMVRVLKPGGRVAVSDVDMGTCYIDSRHHETTRKVLNSFTDSLGSGWVGRSLPRMSRQAGLLDVECAPRVLRGNPVFLHKLLDGHLADARSVATGELALWWEDLTRPRRRVISTGALAYSPSSDASRDLGFRVGRRPRRGSSSVRVRSSRGSFNHGSTVIPHRIRQLVY